MSALSKSAPPSYIIQLQLCKWPTYVCSFTLPEKKQLRLSSQMVLYIIVQAGVLAALTNGDPTLRTIACTKTIN
jgi:hypothetical protein